MGLFSNVHEYLGKWQVKSVEDITAEERERVLSATVVNNVNYDGLSVCFLMKSGRSAYIPIDEVGSKPGLQAGDTVDLTTSKNVTLCRDGDADITRVRVL
jgi:hypothetical protein